MQKGGDNRTQNLKVLQSQTFNFLSFSYQKLFFHTCVLTLRSDILNFAGTLPLKFNLNADSRFSILLANFFLSLQSVPWRRLTSNLLLNKAIRMNDGEEIFKISNWIDQKILHFLFDCAMRRAMNSNTSFGFLLKTPANWQNRSDYRKSWFIHNKSDFSPQS